MSEPSLYTTFLQTTSITASLMAAGGIATMSAFDIPMIRSQPASRSLPMIRWLFSRGSHTMPMAAIVAGLGFTSLGYSELPSTGGTILAQLLNGQKTKMYLVAAVCNFGIALWTTQVMIPTNFRLIKMNESKGGARSAKSAESRGNVKPGNRSAEDSVDGVGEANQWTDLSGPQETTPGTFSEAEEEEVRRLLDRFIWMNYVRAALCTVGGVVGLVTALVF